MATAVEGNTSRFSGRVQNYIKYRPGYPSQILDLLTSLMALSPQHLIADIGSGTGILTKVFLDNGNTVYGVEPNQEMRKAAEQILLSNLKFKSVAATAENTGIESASIDLITAGQAFHWFNPITTKLEFKRILKADGYVALVWNNIREGSTYSEAFEEFLLRHGVDYKELQTRPGKDLEIIEQFFAPNEFRSWTLENSQSFDLEGYIGRFLSISYAPQLGHPKHDNAICALKALFKEFSEDGILHLFYDTKLFLGRVN